MNYNVAQLMYVERVVVQCELKLMCMYEPSCVYEPGNVQRSLIYAYMVWTYCMDLLS
jgi:hypothetical protein